MFLKLNDCFYLLKTISSFKKVHYVVLEKDILNQKKKLFID